MKKDNLLKKHIELVHSKSGHYKTIINITDILYRIVTKVNYLTVVIWVEYMNDIIRLNPHVDIKPIEKINWLIMTKSYRRDLEKRLIEQVT